MKDLLSNTWREMKRRRRREREREIEREREGSPKVTRIEADSRRIQIKERW